MANEYFVDSEQITINWLVKEIKTLCQVKIIEPKIDCTPSSINREQLINIITALIVPALQTWLTTNGNSLSNGLGDRAKASKDKRAKVIQELMAPLQDDTPLFSIWPQFFIRIKSKVCYYDTDIKDCFLIEVEKKIEEALKSNNISVTEESFPASKEAIDNAKSDHISKLQSYTGKVELNDNKFLQDFFSYMQFCKQYAITDGFKEITVYEKSMNKSDGITLEEWVSKNTTKLAKYYSHLFFHPDACPKDILWQILPCELFDFENSFTPNELLDEGKEYNTNPFSNACQHKLLTLSVYAFDHLCQDLYRLSIENVNREPKEKTHIINIAITYKHICVLKEFIEKLMPLLNASELKKEETKIAKKKPNDKGRGEGNEDLEEKIYFRYGELTKMLINIFIQHSSFSFNYRGDGTLSSVYTYLKISGNHSYYKSLVPSWAASILRKVQKINPQKDLISIFREFSIEDLSKKTGCSKSKIVQAWEAKNQAHPSSIYQKATDDSDTPIGEMQEDPNSPDPSKDYENEQAIETVCCNKYLDCFSPEKKERFNRFLNKLNNCSQIDKACKNSLEPDSPDSENANADLSKLKKHCSILAACCLQMIPNADCDQDIAIISELHDKIVSTANSIKVPNKGNNLK